MASGAILGNCPICKYPIWEDELWVMEDVLYHEKCLKKIPKISRNYKNIRITVLEDKVKEIEITINKSIESLKDVKLELGYLKGSNENEG